jgi:hypothetical protein
MSCAREGAEQGIVYNELCEVEKDVVLVDVAPAPSHSAPVNINSAPPLQDGFCDTVDARPSDKETIKVIKKVEFQLLCPQHNPVSVTPSNLRMSFLTNACEASARSEKG